MQQDGHALSSMCSLQDGRNALHYAARRASQNAASALLAASASFTTVDNSGKTPLHLAVATPVSESCVLLTGWQDCTALCSKVGQPECCFSPACSLSILHYSGQLWQDTHASGCGRTCPGGG